ncbi:MAG: hypothetical protein M1504_03485 [Candidatus Marsarchaeota archaeon]|nr:hypothetical protein [Candidatus Marsarchaeota archaeon]
MNRKILFVVIAPLAGATTAWLTESIQMTPTVKFGTIQYGWPLAWYYYFVNYVTGGVANYVTINYINLIVDLIMYSAIWASALFGAARLWKTINK